MLETLNSISEEQQEELMYQANIRMTILYILPDICEALMVDIDEYRKKAGVPPIKFKEKQNWKGLLKCSRELRKLFLTTDMETQLSYEESCSALQDLLMYAIDRCDDKDSLLMQRFIDYIKSFPSKRNIEFKF